MFSMCCMEPLGSGTLLVKNGMCPISGPPLVVKWFCQCGNSKQTVRDFSHSSVKDPLPLFLVYTTHHLLWQVSAIMCVYCQYCMCRCAPHYPVTFGCGQSTSAVMEIKCCVVCHRILEEWVGESVLWRIERAWQGSAGGRKEIFFKESESLGGVKWCKPFCECKTTASASRIHITNTAVTHRIYFKD